MARQRPKRVTNRVTVHTGAAAQAIRLLRWWANDESDEPRVVEMIKQSRECARDLEQDVKKQYASGTT